MSSIYDEWKPLRNHLGKMNINDSLGVIRAYSVRTSLRIKPDFPQDIDPHPWHDRENVFLPWELESLAREIIICCSSRPVTQYTLRNWKQLAQVLNKQKALENYIENTYITSENVLHDLTIRLTHKQFKYQTDRPSHEWMIRWSKILLQPAVEAIVIRKTGLEPKKIFTIGAGLFSNYMTNYGIFYPLEHLSLNSITDEDYEIFMNFFSTSMSNMRKLLTSPEERYLNENFFYGFNSLSKYPLLLTELQGRQAHVCPIPTLLYWRITSGLYYDLINEDGFDNAFGRAFEEYVGNVLSKSLPLASIFPGEPNTATSPKRCDWIIDQPNAALIIECKTKRLTLDAKISLLDHSALIKQLNKLADAIRQAYLSLNAYRKRTYVNPVYDLDSGKKAYVAVVTLEKWYLMGEQIRKLDEIVRIKLTEAGLSESLIDESPYIITSIDDMEELIFLLKTHPIQKTIDPYVESRFETGWEYATFISNKFAEPLKDYVYVFDDDLKDVYTVEIDEKSRNSSRKKKDDI